MRARQLQEDTTTLKQIYGDEYPDDYERIWLYSTLRDFNIPFTIFTIRPRELEQRLISQYRVEDLDELTDKLKPEQRQILKRYIRDPRLSHNIIIVHNDKIIDGNHRAFAAALKGVPIRAIDLAETDAEQLDEKWSKSYKRSIDCNNPKGFSQRAHCAARKARQAGKKTKSKSVNEGRTGTLAPDVARALPAVYAIPELPNQDPYLQYRFGVAIAGAKGAKKRAEDGVPDYGKESAWGENEIIVSFDPNIETYIDDALKQMGMRGKKLISTRKSEEATDVDKTSPIKPFKGYKRR